MAGFSKTSKLSQPAQASLDILLSSITDVVRYAVQKKRYECALIVQEKIREIREGEFHAQANECTIVTRQLNQYKTKLAILQLAIEQYPEDTRDVWTPLVNELKMKIFSTRQARLTINLP